MRECCLRGEGVRRRPEDRVLLWEIVLCIVDDFGRANLESFCSRNSRLVGSSGVYGRLFAGLRLCRAKLVRNLWRRIRRLVELPQLAIPSAHLPRKYFQGH